MERFYMLRVLRQASFKRLNEIVDIVQSQCDMSRGAIIRDIIHCARKFGSGYHDYAIYHFWDIDDEKRDTYLTRRRSKKLISLVNDEHYAHLFDNKAEFNDLFSEYTARDSLKAIDCTEEEAAEFYRTHDRGFAKMLDLQCAEGAEILNMKDFPTAHDFYTYIKEKNFGVVEQVVENHPDIAKVYPKALNTVRMITLIGDDGKAHLLFAAQKFGLAGRFVDVFGMHSMVDLDTGIIHYPFHSGSTYLNLDYTVHPDTGYDLKDFKVPYFDEAKEMILKAALVVPQMRYIGWDVAITPNGPLIIEGNNYTAYDFMSLPVQNPSRIGMMPKILELVPSFRSVL